MVSPSKFPCSRTPDDVLATTALTLFAEIIDATLFLSAGQAIFNDRPLKELGKCVEDVYAVALLRLGATRIRGSFGTNELAGIVNAYAYVQAVKVDSGVGFACAGRAALIGMATLILVLVRQRR